MYRLTPNFSSCTNKKPKIATPQGTLLVFSGRSPKLISDDIYELAKDIIANYPITVEKLEDTKPILLAAAVEISAPAIVVEVSPSIETPVVETAAVETLVEESTLVLPEPEAAVVELVEETRRSRRSKKVSDE